MSTQDPALSPKTSAIGLRIVELFNDVSEIIETMGRFALTSGFSPGTLSRLINHKIAPSLRQLAGMADTLRAPLDELFDSLSHPLIRSRNKVHWRPAGEAATHRERAFRLAALAALEGDPPDEIFARVASMRRGSNALAPSADQAELHWMIRSACHQHLIAIARTGFELEDLELSQQLEEKLAKLGAKVSVHAVKNLAHEDFKNDPLAPFFVTLRAHAVLADFLERHPDASLIGITGGEHTRTFVRCTDSASSPIPDSLGTPRRYTIIPLTSEPRNDHRFSQAEALAGDFSSRIGELIGRKRVTAPSFKAFGHLENDEVGPLRKAGIVQVREHFRNLEVAVFGCGDDEEEGWVRQLRNELNLELDTTPATEIALNLLDARGGEIPLRDAEGTVHELLGVKLRDIRRVAECEQRLAMLLTSGQAKGQPLVAAVRGGYTNVVICDQRAARSALRELESN